MRCHVDKWEDERVAAYNEECFNEALEQIFDEDDLEYYGTDEILWEIEELQKRYHDFVDSPYDMADVLEAMEEEIQAVSGKHWVWDDINHNNKNIFVTNHRTHFRRMRNGKRVIGKRDGPLGVDYILLWI
jgi:hypothetical protein